MILFNPQDVDNLLKVQFPLIRKNINPFSEGNKSTFFNNAHLTDKVFYRYFNSNSLDCLELIEKCLGKRFIQKNIFKDNDIANFRASKAEYQMANWLINKGISPLSSGTKSPDITCQIGSKVVGLEVYSPTEWGGFSYFEDDLKLAIREADLPAQYNIKLKYTILNSFDKNGDIADFKRWEFASHMSTKTNRQAVIDPIVNRINTLITNSSELSYSDFHEDPTHNLHIAIGLEKIIRGSNTLPPRICWESKFISSGVAPEGMLSVALGKVLNKDSQKQSKKDLNILAVDMSELDFVSYGISSGSGSSTASSWYANEYNQRLSSILSSSTTHYDLIIFFKPVEKHQEFIKLPMVYISSTADKSLVGSFVDTSKLTAYSNEIFLE